MKHAMTITPHEMRWVLKVTLVALLLANLPTIVGFFAAPHGTVFSGVSSIAPGDLNVYLSYLEQIRHGHLVFKDLFTAEAQVANVINPFWAMLGLLGSVLRIAPLACYYLGRAVFGVLLCIVLYRFAAYFFDDIVRRRTAFMLAVFASGIGAWAEPFLRLMDRSVEAMPMDLWVSEAFTFLSLKHSPHFLAVSILIVGTVWFMIRSAERSSMRDAVYAGCCMLTLFSFHPFHVLSLAPVTIAMLVTVFVVRRPQFWRQCGRYAVAWAIASPAILYQALLILYDPLAKGRAAENILVTPSIGYTLLGYGFLLVGAIIGSVYLIRTKQLRFQLLVAWALAHGLSIYAPVFFNRRVTHGLNIALAMCAAAAAPLVFASIRRIRLPDMFRVAIICIIAFLTLGLSNVWVLAQDLSFYLNEGRTLPSLFYLTDDENGAFTWLEKNGNDSTVVLCGTIMGNFVPGRSGRRVVVGHNVETINISEKLKDVKTYFTPDTDDAWRQEYLAENLVTHVLVSSREERLGPFNTEKVAYLVPVYESPTVTIYQVSP